MRFKTDENVHPDVAVLLRESGHDALTIWDQNLEGNDDKRLHEICHAEERALITFDLGFSDIRDYPPENTFGLIVLRLGSQDRAHVLLTMGRLIPLLKSEELKGRLWIVEDRDVRIRGGT